MVWRIGGDFPHMHAAYCSRIRTARYCFAVGSYCKITAVMFCFSIAYTLSDLTGAFPSSMEHWAVPDESFVHSSPNRLRCPLMPTSCTAVRCWLFCSRIMTVRAASGIDVLLGWALGWFQITAASFCLWLPYACAITPMRAFVCACAHYFSAAFVLCQAVSILFADVSVLDGSKIWQLASFFSVFSLPPLPSRQQRIAWGAGWDRCAASAVICE